MKQIEWSRWTITIIDTKWLNMLNKKVFIWFKSISCSNILLKISIQLKLTSHHINRRHIFLILKLYLCTHGHYSGWTSCLISFVWPSPSCQPREVSEKSKWNYVPLPGIEPATPCFPARRSNQSAVETVNDLLKLLVKMIVTLVISNSYHLSLCV